MLPHFYKDLCCLFLFFSLVFLTLSCGKQEEGEQRKNHMAFEVCKESQYPDEVKTIIDKHKEEKFRFVYENSAHTYLLAGYGKQEKEEYVVAVRELFEKEEAVVLDTMLIHSSKKGERQTGEEGACPYIVIRCDKKDKPVLFQ